MIGAAWSPSGGAIPRSLMSGLAARVGASPRALVERGGGVVAAWASASLDRETGSAWLGEVQRPLQRASHGHLRGTYSRVSLGGSGLLLARGVLGGKPMYYAREGDGFVACSRLSALVGALTSRPPCDRERLASMACVLPHPEVASTPFVGVSRVGPCEELLVGPAGVSRVPFAPAVLSELVGLDANTAAEELWARIRAAVARAIDGASTVGVMAGGGIDSSGLVAAVVASQRGASPREVLTIALDFAGAGDDRPYLVDLARAFGLAPLRISPRAAGRWLFDSLVVDGGPYVRSSGPLEQLVLRTARDHGVDVLLAGAGGDDLFRADPRALSVEARARPLEALRRAVSLEVPWPTTRLSRLTDFVLRPAIAELAPRSLLLRWRARTQARDYAWVGPRAKALLARVRDMPRERMPRTPGERYDRVARDPWLCDAVDGWAGLEAATEMPRVFPYFDDELLTFVARIPPLTMIHGGRDRALLRLALRLGEVPESICARPDKAWFEPAFAAAVEAGGGFEALRDLARTPRLSAWGVVDSPRFQAEVDRLARDPVSGDAPQLWERVWPVLAVEAFAQRTEPS